MLMCLTLYSAESIDRTPSHAVPSVNWSKLIDDEWMGEVTLGFSNNKGYTPMED